MRVLTKIIAITAIYSTAPLIAKGTPRSGPNSPTATHTNPSSCLGAERATRNSNGGDRAHGAFGKAQSAQVQADKAAGTNYGQGTLKTFKESCTYAPGTTGANQTDTATTPPR